jgi:hypothetical protein
MGVLETHELVIVFGAGVDVLPLPFFFLGFFFPPEEAKIGSIVEAAVLSPSLS